MCLILTAYNKHPDYPLIILANRDEFYERPTQNAHWWENNILAGKDLKAGGTWLGVNRSKQFSALTNFRDPSTFRPNAVSRGSLVSNFLEDDLDIYHYGTNHLNDVSIYNDFNMLFLDQGVLYYFNSLDREVQELDNGYYGLSNHRLNTNWPKVTLGIEQLKKLIDQGSISADAGFDILGDRSVANDEELPETGVGIDKERLLSAMHIEYPGYGTRSSNVVLFRKDGQVDFYEKDHLSGKDIEFSFWGVS